MFKTKIYSNKNPFSTPINQIFLEKKLFYFQKQFLSKYFLQCIFNFNSKGFGIFLGISLHKFFEFLTFLNHDV